MTGRLQSLGTFESESDAADARIARWLALLAGGRRANAPQLPPRRLDADRAPGNPPTETTPRLGRGVDRETI